jgi:hypothetical protein
MFTCSRKHASGIDKVCVQADGRIDPLAPKVHALLSLAFGEVSPFIIEFDMGRGSDNNGSEAPSRRAMAVIQGVGYLRSGSVLLIGLGGFLPVRPWQRLRADREPWDDSESPWHVLLDCHHEGFFL